MILKLAIEQARSQKRYTAWTAALLTFALTLVTFSLIVAATQREVDRMVMQLGRPEAEFGVYVDSPFDEIPPDAEVVWAAEDPISVDDLDSRLDAALALGPGVTAIRQTWVPFDLTDDAMSYTEGFDVLAISGTYDWDLAIGAGTPPGPGEIVISARFAEQHGLDIGGTVALPWPGLVWGPELASSWEPNILTISGLARSGNDSFGGYYSWAPEAYVSWEDSSDPEGLFAGVFAQFEDGGTTWGVSASVYWSGHRPTLASLPGFHFESNTSYPGGISTGAPATASWTGGFALLVLLGTVIMAFSAGRSQAQVRLQWVATARTLGATRRTIAAAAVTETLLVTSVAVVTGFLLGLGAAALHLAVARSSVPLPLLPDTVAVPVWIPAITVGAALLMASIVAAIPAFWASRIPPVAALKPVSDISQAEVSRRVKAWWLVPPFVLGLAAIVLGAGAATFGQIAATLGGVVALTTGYFLWLEGLRWSIPVMGRWLSRRRRPWAIAAGDALASRPRQAVAPAFLQSLTLAIGTLILANTHWADFELNPYFLPDGTVEWYPADQWPWGPTGVAFIATTLGVLVVIQVVILAISFMGQRAASAESATRRALGLSVSGQRRATFTEYTAPQALGILIGVVVGFVATPFVRTLSEMTITYSGDAERSQPIIESITRSAGTCGVVAAFALGVAVVGGLIVAASAGSRTPVEALRPMG